ncbi:hypothetical protein WISP_69408 [Willisornis vidua]|uniref:PH domain-containing protein n=1 Tax=Willisornis vidua TaxID=1566151 RepID=A0ABQ9D7Z5_9PASS|nr:hypothetical protein WISP_69408 [Willisornis vidua]
MSGGEVVCSGWLRKSPPEKKLRRYWGRPCLQELKLIDMNLGSSSGLKPLHDGWVEQLKWGIVPGGCSFTQLAGILTSISPSETGTGVCQADVSEWINTRSQHFPKWSESNGSCREKLPMAQRAWKKRWFVLRSGRMSGDPDVLEYYKNDHSKKPLRVINLNFCEQVDAGLTFNKKELQDSYIFDIKTSDRTFYLVAETEDDMNKWVRSICQICGFNQSEENTVSALDNERVGNWMNQKGEEKMKDEDGINETGTKYCISPSFVSVAKYINAADTALPEHDGPT